jgi:hypothetical protein
MNFIEEVWDSANVKHFNDICKDIDVGRRSNGCFTRNGNGWKNLVEKFCARSGLKLVKT